MSSNFSNSVNNFLVNNSDYTSESVKSELAEIAVELYNRGKAITSIFTLTQDTNMDKNAFTSLFATACDNASDEVNSNQVDLLYGILDTDGDGNLSHDELSVFANSNGEITDFKMWQVVKAYSVSSGTVNGSLDNNSGATQGAGDNGNSSSASGSTSTSDTTDPSSTTGTTDPSSTTSTTDPGTATDATDPSTAPVENEEDEQKPANITTDPVNSYSAASDPQNVPDNLKSVAHELWLAMDNNNNGVIDNDGTDEKTIDDILNAANLTDEEFVDMVVYFENTYGLFALNDNTKWNGKKTLSTLLAKELSGKTEDKAETDFANRLIRAANAGDEDAAFLLSIEVYGATAGQVGTQEKFLDTVFDSEMGVADFVIDKMNQHYYVLASNKNAFPDSKGSMSKDVDADYSKEPAWFSRITKNYSDDEEVSENEEEKTQPESEETKPDETQQTEGNSVPKIEVEKKLADMADELFNAVDFDNDGSISDSDGTDEAVIKDILNDDSISDDDFADMILYFEQEHGLLADKNNAGNKKLSLVTIFEKELSWASSKISQKKAEEKLAERLISAANSGNENAIKVIALEVYGATRGQTGTQQDFLDTIFNSADGVSDEVIQKIINEYDAYIDADVFPNTVGSMRKDIEKDGEGDAAWFSRIRKKYDDIPQTNPEQPESDSNDVKTAETEDKMLEDLADDLFRAMDYNGNGNINSDQTDEASIADVLNSSLTADQFVKLMVIFENKYGLFADSPNSGNKKLGLVSMLEKELSWASPYMQQKKAEELVASKLVEAANNGNEDAIKMLAVEVYSATYVQSGTQQDFLNYIFDKEKGLSDTAIQKIITQYNKYIESKEFPSSKGSMRKDIDADYLFNPSWFDRIKKKYD